MKNSEIKNRVLRDIKLSKLQAEAYADKVLQTAMEDDEFSQIYKQIKELNFAIAKKEFLNISTAEDKKKLKDQQFKLTQILAKLKINKEDLTPKYYCKKCADTGLDGDKFCDCYYKRLNQAIIKNLGVNIDPMHTFENSQFDKFEDKDKIKNVYNKMQNWCEKFETTKYKNVLITGNTGVGKTYLVESICNKMIAKNVVVNYYTAFALNDLFLKYRTSFNENRAGLLDGVLGCDVLIIDDLGSEPNTKNNEEYFYSVFNERLSKNKSTIITTNLDLEQLLHRYGERTFSRLCNKVNSIMFKIDNSDLRLKR